jgi:hypothetical protein
MGLRITQLLKQIVGGGDYNQSPLFYVHVDTDNVMWSVYPATGHLAICTGPCLHFPLNTSGPMSRCKLPVSSSPSPAYENLCLQDTTEEGITKCQ